MMENFIDRIKQLSREQLMILAIKNHKLQNESDAIAIIGTSCRYPKGGNSNDLYWDNLKNGVDCIGDISQSRWPDESLFDPDPEAPAKLYTRSAALLDNIEEFDASFYGISSFEAETLDPQHRLFLEVAWEAFEDAAIAPQDLVGTNTGVFVGTMNLDYAHYLTKKPENIHALFSVGNALSTASGRLSYFFGVKGPAVSVDTACSTSLVTVHLAIQALRNKESDLAIAGGCNLIIHPGSTLITCKATMLSPTGHCHTFDEAADGYTRGEGCGMVVLKRLADAIRDKDDIKAVILGSAINQDGRSQGLTAPNGPSQEAVIKLALKNAGIQPAQVQYVECHGTGTALGDPIEVQSLNAVYGKAHDQQNPLWIGSAKTNMGHTESAAGVGGLLKLVFSLQHEYVPPHIKLKKPNPHIAWGEMALEITKDGKAWQRSAQRRIGAVSSFGFSGTNAHTVVEEAPLRLQQVNTHERPAFVFNFSAKTAKSLLGIAARYIDFLEHQTISLGDMAYTLNVGRSHFAHRLALVADSHTSLRAQLQAYVDGQGGQGVRGVPAGQAGEFAQAVSNKKLTDLAFLFTGQGAQYAGMGQELYLYAPAFKTALDACAEALEGHLDHSLFSLLWGEQSELINHTRYTQPCLFALEYALATWWLSLGVKPRALVGHSVGEYAMAVIASVMSLSDAACLIAARGRLMVELTQPGAMLAVMLPRTQLELFLVGLDDGLNDGLNGIDGIDIAADNGPSALVVSGASQAIDSLKQRLDAEGIYNKALVVSHAFHSPLMTPMLAAFRAVAESIHYHKPTLPIISTLTGQVLQAGEMNANYWVAHIRKPVSFRQAMETLAEKKLAAFIEIGPGNTLLTLAQQTIQTEVQWITSLRRRQGDWAAFLGSAAQCYVNGIALDAKGFEEGYHRYRIALPTYYFDRQRHWHPDAEFSTLVTAAEPAYQDCLYDIQWQPRALPSPPPSPLMRDKNQAALHWVFCSDNLQAGQQLSEALHAKGHTCTLLLLSAAADHALTFSPQHCCINPLEPSHWQQFFAWLAAQGLALDRFVVSIGNAEETAEQAQAKIQEQAQPTVEQRVAENCHALLFATQGLLAAKLSGSKKLWLLSANVLGPDRQLTQPSLSRSPLHGMAKVIALESAEIWGGAIDFDHFRQDDPRWIELLIDEVMQSDGEDQIAYSKHIRHVPRLTPIQDKLLKQAPTIHGQEYYVITGGLGGIGLSVALWLAENGARKIALLSRSGLPTKDDSNPAAQRNSQFKLDTVAKLQALGCQVLTPAIDVTDLAQLNAFFDQLSAGGEKISHVLHAAGVSEIRMLRDMDVATFDRVMEAKVKGSMALHHATSTREIGQLVLFSSIASIWGSGGELHYAAANHFLDTLADYRNQQGLATQVLNWGPWGEVGMAAAHAGDVEKRGLRLLAADQASAVCGKLMHGQANNKPRSQFVIAKVEWSQFKELIEIAKPRPFLSLVGVLEKQPEANAATSMTPLVKELWAKTPEQRQQTLLTFLKGVVANNLSSANVNIEVDEPLHELGIDSLTAVEIRRSLETAFGSKFPATLIFDYPTILGIAKYIEEQLFVRAQAEQQRQQARTDYREPIAIVGADCRYPGAEQGIEQFWQQLKAGFNAISDNTDRLSLEDYQHWLPAGAAQKLSAGLLDQIEAFDAHLFSITPREAQAMDPQQRIILETSFLALENAGYPPFGLRESQTGVFIGVADNEYGSLLNDTDIGPDTDTMHIPTGNAVNAISGRVAYALGLEGPCMAIDTACSSSLVAIHTACQSLRAGECDMALAGGINITLKAETYLMLIKANMLSPTGRCHTFDSKADGYARSEGCGMLVLKRLSDALADNDPIHAVIKGSAINQDGRSSSLTAPNGPAQQRVMKTALNAAGLQAQDIDYLDAHGTGTPLGDPIEVQAVDAVYGAAHDSQSPMMIGSVKTNIGHAESAAGVAGLIKAMLSLEHGMIPKHCNFETVNPHIEADFKRIKILTRPHAWPRSARVRRAAVSSFGFSGTNAHAIVEEAPLRAEQINGDERPAFVFNFSGKTAHSLRGIASRYTQFLQDQSPALGDMAYTLNVGRSHFVHRLALVASSHDELRQQLQAWVGGDAGGDVGVAKSGAASQLAQGVSVKNTDEAVFLFSGQGSQYAGMGQTLYRYAPAFKMALDACAQALEQELDHPLLALLWDEQSEQINHTRFTQPCLFALEYALASWWQALGIKPQALVGHSVGEYAAAVIAGVMSLNDAARLIAARAFDGGNDPARSHAGRDGSESAGDAFS